MQGQLHKGRARGVQSAHVSSDSKVWTSLEEHRPTNRTEQAREIHDTAGPIVQKICIIIRDD